MLQTIKAIGIIIGKIIDFPFMLARRCLVWLKWRMMPFLVWLGGKAENQQKVMSWFASGSGIFFIGLTAIVVAETRISESIHQEIIALVGLAMVAGGFILAMFGYLCMLYWRFWKHFK